MFTFHQIIGQCPNTSTVASCSLLQLGPSLWVSVSIFGIIALLWKEKGDTTHHFKNTLLHQHLWEITPSLNKQVKSLQLQFKSLCTMILTLKVRNILKTAPCRACSTLPNLYSLITIIVFPQTFPSVFIITDHSPTWQKKHPFIWVISYVSVLSTGGGSWTDIRQF